MSSAAEVPSRHRLVAWVHELRRSFLEDWFAPADPRGVALSRLLLYWYAWPGFEVRALGAYAEYGDSAWRPVSFFRTFDLPLFDADTLQAVSFAFTLSSFCALTGIAYRITAPLTAFLALYVYGLPQNFGKINHGSSLLVISLFVFAWARAADVWSFDAWYRRWRLKLPPMPPPSGEYRWPIQFVLLLVVTMYGAAGVAKLSAAGWDWALSDSMRLLLLRHHFTHSPPTNVGVWIADFPRLCQALALGALVLELAAPLALFGKGLRRVVLPGLALLQLSIWLLMGVFFENMIPVFLCLLPWTPLLGKWDAAVERRRAAAKHARQNPRPG